MPCTPTGWYHKEHRLQGKSRAESYLQPACIITPRFLQKGLSCGNNYAKNMPQRIIFQTSAAIQQTHCIIMLFFPSESSHSSPHRARVSPPPRGTPACCQRWYIYQSAGGEAALPRLLMWSHTRTSPRAKDATSNIGNCHKFVFCHKWSMGLRFNFPHCPLSGNNRKYCPESLSHNLKCDPAQFPIRQPSGRWKKSIFVAEWSRL